LRQSLFQTNELHSSYALERLLLIFEKTLPMIGPSSIRTAMTTIATKTRINAYSTSPWPFSLGANNMVFFSFRFRFPRSRPQIYKHYKLCSQKYKPQGLHFTNNNVSLTILQIPDSARVILQNMRYVAPRAGTEKPTRVPFPTALSISKVPPSISARSFISFNPRLLPCSSISVSTPLPLSSTVTRIS
jgi:hypothetical protein